MSWSDLPLRKLVTGVAVAALALTAGCAESQREENDSAEGTGGDTGGTFVFAASSDPATLDPSFASDGETFRVARQMFEGLVGTKPGTAEPAPLLAKSWESSEDGLSYTFELEDGVTFHDGTDFNADAVCANFERWYNRTGLAQSENLSYYYRSLFRGFEQNEGEGLGEPLYKSCEPEDEDTVTINLNRPFAGFVAAMSLPAFSMQSPTAIEKYKGDDIGGTADDPRFSEYASAHPTGTGPFKFGSWERGQQVTLEPYEEYWGDKAKLDKVIVKTISDGTARRQALQNGEIDGYDLVAPADVAGLESEGFQIEQRKPFNILYLGMNQAHPALQDPRVRQAIAHAIDKEALVSGTLPEGTEPATQFMPDTVTGYAEDVPTYEYDPEKAKALLAEAGFPTLEIPFQYPTGVSRPYMPSPEDTFKNISAQLSEVGITVKPEGLKWSPDYLDRIQGTADHGLHLLGWTGDYNDPDNFVGVFFGKPSNEWGFNDPALFEALEDARGLPTVDEQVPAYESINKQIMTMLPGVPLASPVPSLAFAEGVKGYQPSPVQDEVWNSVTVEDEG
ncbi:peptide/nickel transport system substrate-binding protein [Kineococcus xinjiangensis]|uniref:Peptide/nickel transport system substrate-binding protein n=1 Tax=Kineococcus xinjiangensis TaxID=512762 RepID=A0A2S6IPA5_9ACTN|nr:ABC transporter substrate-binding protein [Kineococcus xinjiangensis]PPK96038.1 peptide/nickel transport system substrate-binding protein [Kineococcus xinjiangensis]